MKNLFEPATAEEMKTRVLGVKSDAQRLWGTMTAAQAVAHLAGGLEMALGEMRPPRKFAGRMMGWIIKPLALGNDQPMRRNSPTVDAMVITDDRDLAKERARLLALIDRFVAGGPAGVTTHPHSFFGPMKPNEWAVLMYKHLDHHLRQFGA
jgi:hypothetical protein